MADDDRKQHPTPHEAETVDMEGVRRTYEDVGALPVPRSVLEERQKTPRARPVTRPYRERPDDDPRAREARFRRTLPHAARTPEELARALGHLGPVRRDPQEGREVGPPLPGEPGLAGDS